MGKNVVIFGDDLSLPVHIDNKDKDILNLGKGPAQGLEFQERFVWSLNYNGSNTFLFVNATKIYRFKARISEIKNYVLCLGNTSKYFIINNM